MLRYLRDFLAKNLSLLEPGLRLYQDEEGITGVEFPAGGRLIDILALDKQNNFVVIELTVSKGFRVRRSLSPPTAFAKVPKERAVF